VGSLIQCHASSGPGRVIHNDPASQSFIYTKTINWTDAADDATRFNCTFNGVDIPTEHLLAEASNVKIKIILYNEVKI